MKTIAITILFAMGAAIVLGTVGFSSMEHSTAHSCPFLTLQGTDCPSAVDAALLAIHHIFGVQKLTQAVAATGGVLVLLTVAFFALLIAVVFSPPREAFRTIRRALDTPVVSIHARIVRWLAIHNKRDTQVSLWAHGYIIPNTL